jgi:ATP-dependent Clp protease ATP-binding subunit ClpC
MAVARDGATFPASADLLRGLAAEGDFAREVLRVLGVNIDDIVTAAATNPDHANPLETTLDRAVHCAQALGHSYVGSEHLLLALASAAPTDSVARSLAGQGIETARLREAVVFMLAGFNFARSSGGLASKSV